MQRSRIFALRWDMVRHRKITSQAVIRRCVSTLWRSIRICSREWKKSGQLSLVGRSIPAGRLIIRNRLTRRGIGSAELKAWQNLAKLLRNGLILGAHGAMKTNTVDVQTFQSPNSGALGYVLNGKVFYNMESLKRHTTGSDFDVTHLDKLPKVGIVYSYSNVEADIMTPFLNNGYQGIVHAGVGNGNIHQNLFPMLEKARQQGILVVRSSRVPTGPTTLDAEVDDNKYQFVASQELNPQKARVLLMLALTKTKDWKKIQEYFNVY